MPTLAPALLTLRNQIDGRYPGRRTASDGWIGDAAHASRGGADVSQHNPNENDVVCAIDVTEDLAIGLDCMQLMNELDASNDPRIFYLIHDHQIDNSDDSRTPYHGANPHVLHMHISSWPHRPELYNDAREWAVPMLGAPAPAPAGPGWTGPDLVGAGSGLRGDQGNNGGRVQALQAWLNHNYGLYSALVTDGWWGPKTSAVIAEFGHRSSIPSADGLNIGPKLAAAIARAGFSS